MNAKDTALRKSFFEYIHLMRNPLSGVKRRFSRYVIITCCTGTIGFGVALALLHSGVGALVTLVISAIASGTLNYMAMELWAFPHRTGRLSLRRLSENALVGLGGFGARYLVLRLGLRYFSPDPPFDYAVPLALAYLASFVIGYLLRCRVVFKHNPASARIQRECAALPRSEPEA